MRHSLRIPKQHSHTSSPVFHPT